MAKNVQREKKFPSLYDDLKPTPTSTHTDTHEYTHKTTSTIIPKKKTKDARVQLLMNMALRDELDAYCVSIGLSRNDMLHKLTKEFLNNKEMQRSFEEKYLEEDV